MSGMSSAGRFGEWGSPEVMVVDANSFTRVLVCDLLLQIGVGNIHVLRSGSEIRCIGAGVRLGAIIVALDCGDMSGTQLARRLRLGEFSMSPQTPMVLIAPGLYEKQLQEIVLSGLDEVLIQPLSLDALRSRFRQVMFHRRPFVDSRNYVGPCRRRRVVEGYEGPWRRLCDEDGCSDVDMGDKALYLGSVYNVLSGLVASEWKVNGVEFRAIDFYRLLMSHESDVKKSRSVELGRIWKSAINYLLGTGAGADGRDLDILREHMQISCTIAGMPNANHEALSGRIDELERRSKGVLHPSSVLED